MHTEIRPPTSHSMLRDRGSLVLDAPLKTFISGFGDQRLATKDSRPITLQDLLTHVTSAEAALHETRALVRTDLDLAVGLGTDLRSAREGLIRLAGEPTADQGVALLTHPRVERDMLALQRLQLGLAHHRRVAGPAKQHEGVRVQPHPATLAPCRRGPTTSTSPAMR